MTRLLIFFAIAFMVVSGTIAWILWAYQLSASLADIFLYWMGPVVQLLALVIVVLSSVGTVAGLKRNAARVRLSAMAVVAIGVLGAVYEELNTHFGTLYHSEVNFEAMAPGRTASLTILAWGLLGAVVCLGILKLRGGTQQL